jgi:DNA repair exonuclease SbcCD ATPase subunit
MEIKTLTVSNLFSYKNLNLDLGKLDCALFMGNNGVGKSNIFEIICWILYGSISKRKYKKILRDLPDKPKTGFGILEFSANTNDYVLKRIVGKGKGVSLFENGVDVSLRTDSLNQEKIENIIGVDLKTFLNISYFSQGDVGKFITSDSSERASIIGNIFDEIEMVDTLKESISDDLKQLSYDYSEAKGKLSVIKNSLDEVDVEQLKNERRFTKYELERLEKEITTVSQYFSALKEKRELNNELENEISKYNIHVSSYKDYDVKLKKELISLKSKKDNTDDIYKTIELLDKQASEFETKYELLSESKKKIAILKNKSDRHKGNYNFFKKQIESLENVINGMVGSKCPTCFRIVSENNAKQLEESKNEFVEKMSYEKDVISKIENKISIEEQIQADLLIDLESLEVIKVKKNNLLEKIEELRKTKELITDKKLERKQLYDKYTGILTGIKTKLIKLKDDLKYYKEYDESKYVEYDLLHTEMINRKLNFEMKFKLIDNQIDNYYKDLKRYNSLKIELGKYEKKYEIANYWKQAAPKIKVNMIGNIIPFIEKETNRYLSQILPGKLIKFIVNPDKANNKIDVVIYDYDDKVERILEGWSGGERDKMSLSVYLALNKLVSMKSGKMINFLILDEKFASLDDDSRMSVIDMLRKEYKNRNIWVISHVKEIGNNFKQVVYLEKKNKLTSVTIKENQYVF